MTGSNFLKTVLFAWLKEKDVSVEGLARSGFDHGLRLAHKDWTNALMPVVLLF